MMSILTMIVTLRLKNTKLEKDSHYEKDVQKKKVRYVKKQAHTQEMQDTEIPNQHMGLHKDLKQILQK